MRATFPHTILHRTSEPRFIGASLDPQQSISGAETVIPVPTGRWSVTCSFVIAGEAGHLAWRTFLAQMEGTVGTTLVPIRSRFQTRTRDGRAASSCTVATLAGAQTHEHFGFATAPLYAFHVASAPLRAVDLSIAPAATFLPPRPGQFFTIGERLYRVQHHWETDAGHFIRVQPPLREAVPSGTGAVTNAPVCLMRLASVDDGSFEHLLDRLPVVTATFVEAAGDTSGAGSLPPPVTPSVWDDNGVWG